MANGLNVMYLGQRMLCATVPVHTGPLKYTAVLILMKSTS